MKQKRLETIFKEAYLTPETDLASHVWSVLCLKEQKSYRIRLWSYVGLSFVSLSSLVFVVRDLINQFIQSGSYEYISLAFSDSGSIALYWKEFILSITESLPLTSITISLFLLFIISVSMRRVARQYKNQLSLA